MTDLLDLRRLNLRFIHNFVTNDVAAHDAILHPRFSAIGPDGKRLDRVSYLLYWASAFDPRQIVYWDMRDERIEVFSGVALVSATNRWVRRSGGLEHAGMTGYTDTYIRCNGAWLCVMAQLTPVASAHEPDDATIVVRYLQGVLQN